MANSFFNFKQFSVSQDKCAMKVGTDGVLLGSWVNLHSASSVLDIGTGTGLLALMVAQKSSTTIIDAIDCEEGAFLQATVNFRQSTWNDRLFAHHIPLQEYQPYNRKYDLIISNPPFFQNSLKSPEKERTMARHNDSLSSTELLTGTKRLLNAGGHLFIILPYLEAQLFIVDAALLGLYCIRNMEICPSPRKKVHRVMMEFSETREALKGDRLIIRNAEGLYSAEYKKLTGEYYLNF